MKKIYFGMLCLLPFFGCGQKNSEPQRSVISLPNADRPATYDCTRTLWSAIRGEASLDKETKISTVVDSITVPDLYNVRYLWKYYRIYIEPGDSLFLRPGQSNSLKFEGHADAVARNEAYQQMSEILNTYVNYIRKVEAAKRLNKPCTEEPVKLDDVMLQSQKVIDDFQAKKVGVTPAFINFLQVDRKYFGIAQNAHFPSRQKKTYHQYTAEELNGIQQCLEDSRIKEAPLSLHYRTVAKAYADYLRINDPEKKMIYGKDFLKNELALSQYFKDEEMSHIMYALGLSSIAFEYGLQPEFQEAIKLLPAKWQPTLQKLSQTSADRKLSGPVADYPEISGTDANGNLVSLKDFRGRWILVDCWATWCGVCHGEIPYTNEMEKAFEGKNIVFLGLSVDKKSDTQKWKDCLLEKEMRGVQIRVDDKSSMAQQLGVKGYPSYALINPEGKLVMTSAPRPSSGMMHHVLEACLEETK